MPDAMVGFGSGCSRSVCGVSERNKLGPKEAAACCGPAHAHLPSALLWRLSGTPRSRKVRHGSDANSRAAGERLGENAKM